MADFNPVPRRQEAVPYVPVIFQDSANLNEIHQADCDTSADIGGLKEDLEIDLGDKDRQCWYHNGVLLRDDRSLADYDLDQAGETYRIVVEQV